MYVRYTVGLIVMVLRHIFVVKESEARRRVRLQKWFIIILGTLSAYDQLFIINVYEKCGQLECG